MFSRKYVSESNMVLAEISGRMSLDEFKQEIIPQLEQVARDYSDPPTPNRLYDLRELNLKLTTEEIRSVLDWTRLFDIAVGPSKTALLAGSDLMYGMIRQFEGLGIETHVSRRVFRDPAEALEWLGIDHAQMGKLGLSTKDPES